MASLLVARLLRLPESSGKNFCAVTDSSMLISKRSLPHRMEKQTVQCGHMVWDGIE
jgi:hypothetical protein